jgi:hypothetical protein
VISFYLNYLFKNTIFGAGVMAKVIEALPGKCKAIGLNPSNKKKKKTLFSNAATFPGPGISTYELRTSYEMVREITIFIYN